MLLESKRRNILGQRGRDGDGKEGRRRTEKSQVVQSEREEEEEEEAAAAAVVARTYTC